ncbi:MAG: hypothetical protein K6T34_04875 [Thermoflavifilum sp.]|nr:hypothetical protein [Thermoflavifilum sp.]
MQKFTPDMSDEELDKLFQQAADAQQPEVPPSNWQEIAHRLHHSRWQVLPRGWFWIGMGAAAATIGWLSWKLWLQPASTVVTPPQPNHVVVQQPAYPPRNTPQSTPLPNKSITPHSATAFPSSSLHTSSKNQSRATHIPALPPVNPTNLESSTQEPAPVPDSLSLAVAVANTELPFIRPTTTPTIQTPVDEQVRLHRADFQRLHPYKWSVRFLTGPSWAKLPHSAANYSTFSSGLMLQVELLPRLHVEAGMLWSRAYYEGTPHDYHIPISPSMRENIKDIDASCKITDIPINIEWDAWKLRNGRLFMGTGLSSYLMRRENYVYSYKRYIPGYPWQVSLKNENQHLFAVWNISAGIETYINPHFSIQLQPYFKLPLSNIGYGQARLQSFGTWFSLNYHFQP